MSNIKVIGDVHYAQQYMHCKEYNWIIRGDRICKLCKVSISNCYRLTYFINNIFNIVPTSSINGIIYIDLSSLSPSDLLLLNSFRK